MKEFTNYKYYVYKRHDGAMVVKAKSTYAGKNVYGVAVCAPDDEFNLDTGKKLAAARCNSKVAMMRYERSIEKYNTLVFLQDNILTEMDRVREYVADSADAVNEAKSRLETTLKGL